MTGAPSSYDYFVSGRWRNRDSILELARQIREAGHSAYCFLESDYNAERLEGDPDDEMSDFEATVDWRNDAFVRDVFERDTEGLRASEKYVLLLLAGKSCHIEAGAAWSLGKECILIGQQDEAESLYLTFAEFYEDIESFSESLGR